MVHITGAINVYYRDLKQDGKIGLMKSVEELAEYFGNKGISENSKVIIYDDGKMKAAARTYWILKYLGAKDVKILNGGIDGWKEARKPVTSAASSLKATTFNPTVNEAINVDLETVKNAISAGDIILVDSREPEYFKGEKGVTERDGHIPGSINFDYTTTIANKSFKSKEGLIALAAEYGITPESQVIVYCNSGVKGAVLWFALKEIAGFENIMLYEGSFNEYEADENNAVATE
jgi:thiosulfate/3-mercaptopyruvate sulfurtransferase